MSIKSCTSITDRITAFSSIQANYERNMGSYKSSYQRMLMAEDSINLFFKAHDNIYLNESHNPTISSHLSLYRGALDLFRETAEQIQTFILTLKEFINKNRTPSHPRAKMDTEQEDTTYRLYQQQNAENERSLRNLNQGTLELIALQSKINQAINRIDKGLGATSLLLTRKSSLLPFAFWKLVNDHLYSFNTKPPA